MNKTSFADVLVIEICHIVRVNNQQKVEP
jgi:hypothetical protein